MDKTNPSRNSIGKPTRRSNPPPQPDNGVNQRIGGFIVDHRQSQGKRQTRLPTIADTLLQPPQTRSGPDRRALLNRFQNRGKN